MIPLHKVLMADDAADKVKETLYSGMLTEGPRVKEFEVELEKYLGCPVLTMNSCTSAIDLALHLIGIGPGDQVIGTPMTCAATYCGVIRRGAQMVWADIDRETGNIDPQSVASRATVRTKAIIVVDWGGRPVDCQAIRLRCPHAPIIQDAAHSFGANAYGLPAHAGGLGGDYVAWSFQAIKHLTTGDGGALKVPAEQFARARALRWFGIDRETKAKFRFLQNIPEAGFKYHMNDLAATIGLANLPHAIQAVRKHTENAAWLHGALADCRRVNTPPLNDGKFNSSWWFYSLGTNRWEDFVKFAEERGVGAGPVHGRNDRYTGYDAGHVPLIGTHEYASRHVAIPCGWWLTQQDLERIAEVVIEWDKTL
jgi:dTDP-4-amino-4,6-dideoxygalactose transaminase